MKSEETAELLKKILVVDYEKRSPIYELVNLTGKEYEIDLEKSLENLSLHDIENDKLGCYLTNGY